MPNKKIFNVVAEFELDKKPDWLDDFRKKYDKPYHYHITFKNNTYFEESDLEKIKIDLENILKSYRKIKIIFNNLFFSQTSKGNYIMIRAEKNEALDKLQKEISSKLSKYGNNISEEYKKFETNFEAHITIARALTQEQLNSAKTEMKEDIYCEVELKEVFLTIAKEDTFDEWNNPNNKTLFKLNKISI
jgi:2'-5' RNA ligase